MKFGLFGGARARGGPAGDSEGYHNFIKYVVAAEELGFSSVFLVEHHFTGSARSPLRSTCSPISPRAPRRSASAPRSSSYLGTIRRWSRKRRRPSTCCRTGA